ncbi:MAG: FAD:protein FMN transferase [Sphingobacteriales bacterium]|nr:FAD:protein FMN transferase [Sphingobacteriales bacterium]OJW00840.1 MAG: thiamine biosynthesis protein ApbE [Sphingobacteriales bacterium 44-61]
MNRLLPVLISCILTFSFGRREMKKIQINGSAQGTTYHITYYAKDCVIVKSQIDSLLNAIDQSLSLYNPNSLINQFNQSNEGLTVDNHFVAVTKAAQSIFQKTNGLFDITIGPLTKAWGFGPVKPDSLPNEKAIQSLLPCVDSRLLYWEGKKLKKKDPCVQLDANGIAQGYSVDQLGLLLEQNGISDYLVELGGEIRVKGKKWPEQTKMSVGIETPGEDFAPTVMKKIVWLDKGALTTSGNYRRYRESGGKHLSHLINPRTGYPFENELISVTVYAPDAITADAYDNALMGMGLRQALDFVEKQPGLGAYFIYRQKNGNIADSTSRIFRSLLQP